MNPNKLNIDDKKISYSSWSMIKDALFWAKPYKIRFIFGATCRLVSDLAGLYQDFAVASFVSFFATYTSGDSLSSVWRIFIFLIIASLIAIILNYLGKYNIYRVGEKVSLDVAQNAMKHIFKLDIAWQEKENSGNKMKRIQNAQDGYYILFRILVNNMIEIVVNFVVVSIVIYHFDKTIGILMVFFLVTYLAIARPLTIKAANSARECNIEEERVSGIMFEGIANIRTVKLMSIGDKLLDMVSAQFNSLYSKITRRIFLFQYRNTILGLWGRGFLTGMSGFIIYRITQGVHDIGFLVLFIAYFKQVYTSARELTDVSQDFVIAKHRVARLKEILDTPVGIDNEENKKEFPANWSSISMIGVNFSYKEKEVLHNISFKINRGERVGIMGLSGAGKSTLFKLFLKEYESRKGEILFDDDNLKYISKKSYFKNVAVVLQDTEVFNLSLIDNITITSGEDEIDRNQLDTALEVAHIKDFMNKLPNGLNTIIGEKGVKLSGGERQRVGIARAIYKKPEILFLDEATSHLDIESEEKIRDSLHQFFKEVTAIVIAHRLTTIKEMDRIIVLEGGKIIEEGSFEELYKKKGRFFELWEKQKL